MTIITVLFFWAIFAVFWQFFFFFFLSETHNERKLLISTAWCLLAFFKFKNVIYLWQFDITWIQPAWRKVSCFVFLSFFEKGPTCCRWPIMTFLSHSATFFFFLQDELRPDAWQKFVKGKYGKDSPNYKCFKHLWWWILVTDLRSI